MTTKSGSFNGPVGPFSSQYGIESFAPADHGANIAGEALHICIALCTAVEEPSVKKFAVLAERFLPGLASCGNKAVERHADIECDLGHVRSP
ncbi:hypothetical protein ACU8MG_25975 (plasmid) [Rhizobium leguminosarum]